MRIALIALSLIAVTVTVAWAQPGLQDIEWDVIYTADKMPKEAGWGKDLGPSNSAELVDDALHLIDAASATGERNCYSNRFPARPDRGAILQATIKVVSNDGPAGICLMAADGTHEDGLTLYPDHIELSGAGLRYDMDTTDDFHTYCMRMAGTAIEVWVDDELVIDGWGKFAKEAYHGRRTVVFGSISSAAKSESYWKDVRYVTFTIPATPLEGAENVIIYRKDGIYACFPSLMQAEDGRLFTGFGTRVNRSHIDGTGGSARAVSSDGGYTWEITDEVADNPRYKRADGTVFIPQAQGWIYVDEEKRPEIEAQGRTIMKAREGTIAYLGDPEVLVTRPDGEKERIELPTPTPGGVMGFHHASAFLHEGPVWMTAIYGTEPDVDDGAAVWAVRSEDDGETWEVTKIAGPQPGVGGFNETAICDNGQGEIIAVMRPRNTSMHSYQCFSNDGGKTWGPPLDTGFWGYPSNVIRLEDGRLLCTFGYRRESMGIRAVLSSDGGHTWDVKNTIVLRADGHGNGGDNGYPLSLQMDDGHIFTIYYINDKENVTHIAGTNWELPEKK